MTAPFTRNQKLRKGLMVFALCLIGPLAFLAVTLTRAHAAEPTHISITASGSGPDVVFIPGLASSAHVWDPQIARLKGYRIHVVQVRGFAGTEPGGNASGPVLQPVVDDIAAYIEANHLNAPAVIGHSMGGLAGLMLAKQHPQDVGRLMIVDSLPFTGLMFSPLATLAAVEPQARAMRDGLAAGSQAAYATAEPATMARLVKSTGPEAQAAIKAAVASDHSVVARALYDDLTTDLRPDLSSIKTPVTLLYPWDAATGAPQAMFDSLYTSAFAPLPHKTIIRIDGAFHFIQIDQPEAFDRQVQAFLKR